MKTEIFKMPEDGSLEVHTRFDPAEVALYGHRVMDAVIGAASQMIADQYVKENANRIIAQIPIETVLNRVVAECVIKIGAATEPKR